MKREDYVGKARAIGEKVTERYLDFKAKYEEAGDVRGLGAMIGIEFVKTKEGKDNEKETFANDPCPEWMASYSADGRVRRPGRQRWQFRRQRQCI